MLNLICRISDVTLCGVEIHRLRTAALKDPAFHLVIVICLTEVPLLPSAFEDTEIFVEFKSVVLQNVLNPYLCSNE